MPTANDATAAHPRRACKRSRAVQGNLYIGSLAKVILPDLHPGYVPTDAEYHRRILFAKQASDRSSGPLVQRASHRGFGSSCLRSQRASSSYPAGRISRTGATSPRLHRPAPTASRGERRLGLTLRERRSPAATWRRATIGVVRDTLHTPLRMRCGHNCWKCSPDSGCGVYGPAPWSVTWFFRAIGPPLPVLLSAYCL